MVQTFLSAQRAFPWLGACTIYCAILLAASMVLAMVDTRLVVGVNAWLKPLKFGVSIILFNVTVGWLLARLSVGPASAKAIAGSVAAAMFVEITAIVLQAARGVPSHYNRTTPFNGFVFDSMAIAILINTLAIGWLGVLSFRPQPQLAPALAWGIRLGLAVFLLGSVEGMQMVGHRGHTVGMPDGGPGLPLLRWSTMAGDLRVAHFIGLHGLQALPLLGYLVSRGDRQAGTWVVAVAFVAMTALFGWSLRQAWVGRPLL